jgi:hypothetical protein
MFSIFLKDLKEKFFLILFFLILPLLVPYISHFFFNQIKEDATLALYGTFYYIILPLYFLISLPSILTDENIRLIKNLPISFNKIIFSKLLFLILNYIIFTIIYYIFFNKYYYLISNEKFNYPMIFNIYFVLILVLFSFSLCNLTLKKINSVFFAFLLIYFNFYILFKLLKNYYGLALTFYGIYYALLFLLILSIFLAFYSSKILLIGKKLPNLSIFLLLIIFLLPSFYIFNIKEKIFKTSLALSFPLKIDDNNIILSNTWEEEYYLYNIKNKKLKQIPQLNGLYLKDYKEDKLYYYIPSKEANFCTEKIPSSIYYTYDLKTNNVEKVGVFPSFSYIIDDIIFWHQDKNLDKIEINFSYKNFKNCFKDICDEYLLLKNGIFYRKYEENSYKFFYVDFKNIEKKEVLKGEYGIEGFIYWQFKNNVNYVYLSKQQKLFKFDLLKNSLQEIGKFKLLFEFKNGYALFAEKNEDNIILHLLKNDKIVKSKKVNYPSVFSYPIFRDQFYGKYLFLHFIKNNKFYPFIVSTENDDICLINLPEKTENVHFLNDKGDVILIKRIKIPIFGESYMKAFLYNFKTGKEESL